MRGVRHSGHSGDVAQDMVQLNVHLHQRLLHVLDVRGCVLDHAFAMAKVRSQRRDLRSRTEARPQKPVRVQLLDPLGIVDVRLPPRHILRVPRVDKQDLEAFRLENLEDRNPVHACRLHRDGRHADTNQPVGEPLQITCERPKRPDWLRIGLPRHSDHVHRRADVDARCATMNLVELAIVRRSLLTLSCSHDGPLSLVTA
jgi:hypothetical protein